MKIKTIIITGPTATGKTALATQLCRQFDGEIISADSRQIYRGLDIGTGKDLSEYHLPTPVNFHLIDIINVTDEYSLVNWRQDFIKCFSSIVSGGKLPVICGGTPLYLDMLLNNYSLEGKKRQEFADDLRDKSLDFLVDKLKEECPERAKVTDLTQKERVLRALEIGKAEFANLPPLPECEFLILAPYWHRNVVHSRIENRLHERWKNLKIEVEQLLKDGVIHERLEWFGLEYRYFSKFFRGELTEKELFEQLLIKIRQFAKRQDIWFRKIENGGHPIYWLDQDDKLSQAKELINLFLSDKELPERKLKISEVFYGPRTN